MPKRSAKVRIENLIVHPPLVGLEFECKAKHWPVSDCVILKSIDRTSGSSAVVDGERTVRHADYRIALGFVFAVLVHQLNIIQFETTVFQGRFRFVETSKQKESPFRIGGEPITLLALGGFRPEINIHRTILVLLYILHVGVESCAFLIFTEDALWNAMVTELMASF